MAKRFPILVLPEDFDEQGAAEAELKGHLSCAIVELENGDRYKLNFINDARLSQDLAASVGQGRRFIAEQGLVVLPRIDIEEIEEVLAALLAEGFFDHLRPLSGSGMEESINAAP